MVLDSDDVSARPEEKSPKCIELLSGKTWTSRETLFGMGHFRSSQIYLYPCILPLGAFHDD